MQKHREKDLDFNSTVYKKFLPKLHLVAFIKLLAEAHVAAHKYINLLIYLKIK